MENNFRIFCFFILPFLPITPFACNSQSRERQSFKFYHSGSGVEGTYHVIITGAENDDIDMSVVGCTNLEEKSSWTMIDHYHHQKPNGRVDDDDNGNGNCVVLYRKKDCQGRSLKDEEEEQAAPDFDYALEIHDDEDHDDYVKSFHLCPWKGSAHSALHYPETFQALHYYRLFSANISLLAQYTDADLSECKNLPEAADKLATALETYGSCLNIYDNKDCRGESIKFSSTSWSSSQLKDVGWENRTSSIKLCDHSLQARITNFRPTSTIDELEKDNNGQLHKIHIGHVTTFANNDGTNSTWKTYEEQQHSFNESFLFERIEGLSQFDSVEVVNNISLKDVMFPRLCFSVEADESHCLSLRDMKREIKKQLKNAYQVPPPPSSRNIMTDWMAENPRNFSFLPKKAAIEIPPCSEVEVRSILFVKNITFRFELGVEISGKDQHGRGMTSDELWRSLPHGMNYSRDLDQFRIFAKVKGRILARLGVKPDVEVRTLKERIPGCGNITQDDSTSSTEMEDPKESEAFKGESDMDNSSVGKKDRVGQNGGGGYFGVGQNNLFIIIIVGMSIACVILLICLITLCLQRRSRGYGRSRNESECGILSVGGYVLTIECLCCPKCK